MVGVKLRSGRSLDTVRHRSGRQRRKMSEGEAAVKAPDQGPSHPNNDSEEAALAPTDKAEANRLLLEAGFTEQQVEIFLRTFDGDNLQVSGASEALHQIIELGIDRVRGDLKSQLEQELAARQGPQLGGPAPTPKLRTDSPPPTQSKGKTGRGRSKSASRMSGPRAYIVSDGSDQEDEIEALSFQRRKNHRIPSTYKFTGSDKDDVHSFVRNMEKQQKQALISDADMAMILPYHLSGKALTWYLQRSDEDQENWSTLKQNLLRMFSRVKDEFQVHSELANLTQGTMSIMDFSFKVSEIASRCDAPDSKKLVTFVSGLCDDDVKIHLSKERPTSFDAAVVAALDYEYEHRNDSKRALLQKLDALTLDVHKHHREVKELSKSKQESPKSPHHKQQTDNSLLFSIQQQLNQHQQQLMAHVTPQQNAMVASVTPSTPTPAQSIPTTATCYKCGQSGHWRRDCPSHRVHPPTGNNHTGKYCDHCQMKGHMQSDCSWFNKGVPCPYCTKCKRKGHDNKECRRHPN